MRKKCWQKLQKSMELNGNRKVHMKNIWMFIISKKKERKKEVQELEQEKENLTAENEGLTFRLQKQGQILSCWKKKNSVPER